MAKMENKIPKISRTEADETTVTELSGSMCTQWIEIECAVRLEGNDIIRQTLGTNFL